MTSCLAFTIDLLPTLISLCGAPVPHKKIDGVDISAILKGDLKASPRKHFYYYYRKNSLKAVRRENWKLVLDHPGRTYEGFSPGNDGFPGKTKEQNPIKMAMYDLRRDPGERYDEQETYPELVKELLMLAEEARADLGDDLQKREGANCRSIGQIQ